MTGTTAAPVAGLAALSLGPPASGSQSAAVPAPIRPPEHLETDDDEDDEDDGGVAPLTAPGADLQHETTVKAGYLYKKGEKRKTWKKRWFVLRSSRLAYYKNDKEYQLLRLIDMADVHTVAAVELKRSQYGFGIVTPKRTFYIKASDAVDQRDWIEKLNQVKRAISEPNDEGLEYEDRSHQPYSPTLPSGPMHATLTPSPQRPQAAAGVGSSTMFGRSPVTSDSEASGAGFASRHASPEIGSAPRFAPMGDLLTPNLPSGAALLSSSEDDWNEDEPPALPLPGQRAPDVPVPERTAPANAEANAAFLRDPSRVLLQGYLLKQSARRKVWRKRWFVLTSSQLLWAGSHMDTRTKRRLTVTDMVDAIEYEPSASTTGPISLAHPHRRDASPGSPQGGSFFDEEHGHSTLGFLERRSSIMNGISQGAASAIGAGNKKRQENCFRVITPKRTLLLCAPSEEEEIKWLSTLQTLISRVRDARDARAQEQRNRGA